MTEHAAQRAAAHVRPHPSPDEIRHRSFRITMAVLGIAAGIVICNLSVDGLSHEAMKALGITVGAILFWVGNVFADYIVALMMTLLFILTGTVSFSTAFSSFSGETVWMVLGAFGVVAAVEKSGLLQRVILWFTGLLPRGFRWQALGIALSGAAISPLIPSSAAKSTLIGRISTSISKSLGFPSKSVEASGIFLAGYMGMVTVAPAFLSASSFCYAIRSAIPAPLQAGITWGSWLINMLPWLAVYLPLSCLSVILMGTLAKKHFAPVPSPSPDTEPEPLKPVSRDMVLTGIIMILALLLWMTEQFHGIPSQVVSVSAMTLLLALNILNKQDFKTGIAWNIIVFIGAVLNLGTVFDTLGISQWLCATLAPLLAPLITRPYLFLPLLFLLVVLLRLIVISQMSLVILFVTMLAPAAAQCGMHPFIIGVVTLMGVQVWLTPYQNVTFITALSQTQDYVARRHTVLMAFAYLLICIAGICVSIPYWQSMSLI